MRTITPLSRRRIALAFALLVLTVPAWGGSDEVGRITLKGIKALDVLVHIDPQLEPGGLENAQIRLDIEARLRQAGITVEPPFSSLYHLFIVVDALEVERASFYAYTMHVQLRQEVLLVRDPTTTTVVPTWEVGYLGVVDTGNVAPIQSVMTTLVGRFITAYREQNPKP